MAKDKIRGVALAPGVGTGRLFFAEVPEGTPGRRRETADTKPENEGVRFEHHVESLVGDLHETVAQMEAASLSAEAQIIRAHVSILEDPDFRRRVHEAIQHAEMSAEAAVETVVEEFARLLHESGSLVLAERVADLRDLAARLRAKLREEDTADLSELSPRHAVLALPEMLPSVTIEAWQAGVRAVVVEKGTALSHSAILAKSFSLPVIRVASLEPLREHAGDRVLVDADAGLLVIGPRAGEAAHRARECASRAVGETGSMPARLWLNVMTPEELDAVDWEGVEGVGLFRSEPLFLASQDDFPDEREQTAAYAKLFALCGHRPVTVRTLDAGGDKPLAYMSLGREENPQLGLRAHRLYRFHPELLITQVRAILRAGVRCKGQLRVMHPLVGTLDEWQFLQDLTREAVDSLRADRLTFRDEFATGLMVETPAAVWSFRCLIEQADFAAIGTNDLVQYMLAVDRSNANVAALNRPEDPVMLQVLKDLVETARAVSKPLSLCGEIAADHYLLPLLLGLGIRDFSVSIPGFASVRRTLASLQTAACEAMAEQCLRARSVVQVRQALDEWHEQACPWERHVRATATDPVCKMVVDPGSAPYSVEHDGKRYFFCQRRCMEAFQQQLIDS